MPDHRATYTLSVVPPLCKPNVKDVLSVYRLRVVPPVGESRPAATIPMNVLGIENNDIGRCRRFPHHVDHKVERQREVFGLDSLCSRRYRRRRGNSPRDLHAMPCEKEQPDLIAF